jgi:hypothetical protein
METFDIEHSVEQKREGKLRIRMWLLLAFYLLTLAIGVYVVFKTVFIAIGAIIPLVIYTEVLCTWRFVCVEQKTAVESGELLVFRKFGNSKPKNTLRIRIKDAVKIAPVSLCKDEISKISQSRIYDARPSCNAKNIYAVIYLKDGKECALLLQVTEKTLKAIRYYNDATVMANLD